MPKWDHQARPCATHPHGAIALSEEGRRLETDAMYFRSRSDAEKWAASRGWRRYELTEAVGF